MSQLFSLLLKWALISLVFLLPLTGSYDRSLARNWQVSRPLSLFLLAENNHDSTLIDYLSSLNDDSFRPISQFITAQANRYGLDSDQAVTIQYTQLDVNELPSVLVADDWASRLIYSIKFRLWCLRHLPWQKLGTAQIVAFYVNERVSWPNKYQAYSWLTGPRSLVALNGARQTQAFNNIQLTNQYLASLGATQKIDAKGLPAFPDGFADVNIKGLYPQNQAEIMAGLMVLGERRAVTPMSLDTCMVGNLTAKEIGWPTQ